MKRSLGLIGLLGLLVAVFVAGMELHGQIRDDQREQLDLRARQIEELSAKLHEQSGTAEPERQEIDSPDPSGSPQDEIVPFEIDLTLGQEVRIPRTELTVALKDIDIDGEHLVALTRFSKPGWSKTVMTRAGEERAMNGVTVRAIEVEASRARLRVLAEM
jgi:hypothetical protein